MTKRLAILLLLFSLFALFQAQFPTPEEFQNSSVFFDFNVTTQEHTQQSNFHHRRHKHSEGETTSSSSSSSSSSHSSQGSPPSEKPWWEKNEENEEVHKHKKEGKMAHFLKKHRVWVIVALVLLKILLIGLLIYCGVKCYRNCQKKKQQKTELQAQQELAHQTNPIQQPYFVPGMNPIGGQAPIYYGVPLNPNQPQQPYVPIHQPYVPLNQPQPQNFHPIPPPPPPQGYYLPQQQRYPTLNNERMNYPPQCAVLGDGQNAGYPRV